MDNALYEITAQSWLLDFRFMLDGAFRGSEEAIQIALLEDRLESIYAPNLISRGFNSLKYSFNWMMRNWDYFEEIGMVRRQPDGFIAIENGLIYALHHFSSNLPLETLPMLPEMPASNLVTMAQKFIDADRSQ